VRAKLLLRGVIPLLAQEGNNFTRYYFLSPPVRFTVYGDWSHQSSDARAVPITHAATPPTPHHLSVIPALDIRVKLAVSLVAP